MNSYGRDTCIWLHSSDFVRKSKFFICTIEHRHFFLTWTFQQAVEHRNQRMIAFILTCLLKAFYNNILVGVGWHTIIAKYSMFIQVVSREKKRFKMCKVTSNKQRIKLFFSFVFSSLSSWALYGCFSLPVWYVHRIDALLFTTDRINFENHWAISSIDDHWVSKVSFWDLLCFSKVFFYLPWRRIIFHLVDTWCFLCGWDVQKIILQIHHYLAEKGVPVWMDREGGMKNYFTDT